MGFSNLKKYQPKLLDPKQLDKPLLIIQSFLHKAPLVVKFFQLMLKNRTGKFVLATIAKASPTIKATFCPSKAIPRKIATIPIKTLDTLETNNSFFSSVFSLFKT